MIPAIEGSTYCGLPSHQALSRFETNQIAILASIPEAEIEILADPDADQGQVDQIVAKAESEFVEEIPDEAPEAEAAGPVVTEDSSSSQAAGEESPATPPAEAASEPQHEALEESAKEPATEQAEDGAAEAEPQPETVVAEEAEQA